MTATVHDVEEAVDVVEDTSRLEALSTPGAWVAVVLVSAGLGAAMGQSWVIATMHMAVTLLVALGLMFFARGPAPIAAIIVYAGLCDVLWRASGARGPYESSKYVIVIGCALLVVRFVKQPRHLALALIGVLLLVPGSLMTMAHFGVVGSRQLLAATLLGLVAILVAVVAWSNLHVTQRDARGLYLVAVSPIVSMTALATRATMQSEDNLNFVGEANFTAAGGFGPNQVSSILCLGGLLCILVMLQPGVGWRLRALALATGTWMVGQAVLTFSRGGLLGLVLAVAAIGLVALTMSGQRGRVVVAVAVLVVVALQILSWAGAFTEGASEERFSSVDTTNRTEIARADIELFFEQPWGVGVAISPLERDYAGDASGHTEATRLLAEHGLAGLAIVLIVITLCIQLLRTARGWQRLAAAGLLSMAVAQTFHSATRIGSVAIAFALAALVVDEE